MAAAVSRTEKRTRASSLVGLWLLVCLVVPLGGCGAAMSTYLILAAQIDVDAAEAAEAEKYAPYEYTAAQEYLHKAREEQGYADFGPAIEYAFMAQEFAEKATERAEKVKSEQQPPPGAPADPELAVPPPSEPAPAGGIIIRKKPEDQVAPGTPDPGASEPAPELELVPPSASPGESGSSGSSSSRSGQSPESDEHTEVKIVPVAPEQPPAVSSPRSP